MRETKFRARVGKRVLYMPDFRLKIDGKKPTIQLLLIHYGQPSKRLVNGSQSMPKGSWDLMQYIGIKDKNGKEIYEGDIVNTGMDYNFEIAAYKSGYGLFYRKTNKDFPIMMLSDFNGELEIVGNIYENPELLK